MKVSQMPPVHAANLVANSGNTAYGVDVIMEPCIWHNVLNYSDIYMTEMCLLNLINESNH